MTAAPMKAGKIVAHAHDYFEVSIDGDAAEILGLREVARTYKEYRHAAAFLHGLQKSLDDAHADAMA